jgi:hypothetical protein
VTTTYSVKQRLYERADPRLGRHVQHDSRSLSYPYRAPAGVTLTSVRHPRHVPVLDQGQLGSCTANGGLGAVGTGRNWVGDVVTRLGALDDAALEALAVDVYSEETRVDTFAGAYPPDDTGSSGLAASQVLKSRGFISGYQHTFTLTDALAALQVGPIICGTDWHEDQFDPAADGRLSITGAVAGGHEYCVDEIDVPNQRVWLTNSWGTSWGVKGRAYYTWADFGKLLAADGDVVLFVPLDQPAPPPQPPTPPTPSTDPAGDALWAATRQWTAERHVGDNGKAAKAVAAWAKATGRS